MLYGHTCCAALLDFVQHHVVCEVCIDITTCVFNSYDLSSSEEERDAVRGQKRYVFSSANIISFYFSWISLWGIFPTCTCVLRWHFKL